MVLVVLLILPADADWRNTVNKAGEQMILSEKMTKDLGGSVLAEVRAG